MVHFLDKIELLKAYLYVFDNKYLIALSPQKNYLLDILQKTKPRLLSEFVLATDKHGYINAFLGLSNKKAYFTIGYSGVEIIDFRDESNPVSLGLIQDYTIGWKCSFYSDNYLITNPKTSMIYDISNPIKPKILYKFDDEILDFLIIRDYLLCATNDKGLMMLDISQPSNPHKVSSLEVNVVRLYKKDNNIVLTQGVDDVIYILTVNRAENIFYTTKIEMPGPILSDSLLFCKNNNIFVRFMRKRVGDTLSAFNLQDIKKPKQIFSYTTLWVTFYTANENFLILAGIKNWDGVSALTNYNTQLYKIFSIQSNEILHIGDIELEGIWFSNIILLENILYIARPDSVYIYEIR